MTQIIYDLGSMIILIGVGAALGYLIAIEHRKQERLRQERVIQRLRAQLAFESAARTREAGR